ncbi:MAG: DUF2268 domain-containing putative Zn-dependent protease [Candidatus Magasanikbacteria bacterium]|nr:DUF2268 domain-containing putative Zn-dependent protease [Candidatus Magasanikbacteria bacterium]
MTESSNNINSVILNASKRFDPFVVAIQSQTKKAIDLALTKIALHDVDIVFSLNPIETVAHLGFGGYTPDANTVLISVNTDFEKLGETIETELIHTLLHEFHHAMRWRSVGYGDTLGEAIVTEGLGDQFDVELTGGAPQKWATALSAEELSKLFLRAKPLLGESYEHAAWFFGSESEELPKWGGYALGWFVVGKYLEAHPEKHASDLHAVSAAEILSAAV